MKMLLIPIICLILGIGGGVGAGIMLAPAPEPEEAGVEPGPDEHAEEHAEDVAEAPPEETQDEVPVEGVEYADLSSQFIVPLLVDGRVDAIMVLAIGLEVLEGSIQVVLEAEPKIRAGFLQALFNHANNGGFSGNFTEFSAMGALKRELLLVAKSISGDNITDVLILDVVRQAP